MLIYKAGTGRGAGVMENIARYFATNKGRAEIKLIVRRRFKTSNIENLLPMIIITTAPLPPNPLVECSRESLESLLRLKVLLALVFLNVS